MAKVEERRRPLSPHIQIYRPQITSVSSILTRISGNGLIVGFAFGIWWLAAAAVGGAYFDWVDGLATSWFGDLVFTGSLWAMWYHYLGGLRHVLFDTGRALELSTAEALGWGCIVGSVVLTVLTLLII